MSVPVFIYLTPPEGLIPLLTPERLAAFREWFSREVHESLDAGETPDEDQQALIGFVDHLLQQGSEALRKPPERFQDSVLELLDEVSDYFTREEAGIPDGMELATELKPTEQEVRASDIVIAETCPKRTLDLWRHLVWGRAPDRVVAEGIGLRRNFPSMGYWTATEARQVRDDLRQHLGEAPDYQPLTGKARFMTSLRRMLSATGRAAPPTPAIHAITQAVNRASREGAGLLFAR
ncbi:hypothetical protein [Corallococcus macrosporus]|uniref:Uncharacterized protein n=1 Tax=Corallococcus macrosporus DSM 14697 TaxID=1189310 RepID=A0A250K5D5_9BACT|nr:hypothetical protein [Corallococcus macrosporus]ATB51120.1 hypothetical protein MYMAC_006777 [Corallococcus macrosporus DSM 14697]